MTLRHRLFLVYLIVVVLSVATVGIAVLELYHSRRIFSDLRRWHEIVLKVQKLQTAFERDTLLKLVPADVQPPPPPKDADFAALLKNARDSVEFGIARWETYKLSEQYEQWREVANKLQAGRLDQWKEADWQEQWNEIALVRRRLDSLNRQLATKLALVQKEAEEQDERTRVLLVSVLLLTALHVLLVGFLLRRWLLRPMERLNRQVGALAHDRPPAEPLLASPREMANLAQALESARRSLGELRRQLIESERMITIGQFTAQLAHNLRNPLASIRAVAQVTARHHPPDAYVKEHMEEIVASIDRLNRWIEGLMEVARREPTPTRSADVTPGLQRVREALARELSTKELSLTIIAPPQGLLCRHDPETLEHALVAMLVNAIEASPLGGKIVLQAERIAAETNEAVCRISVRDHGSGLPVEDPERIFEFSYSTKQRGMGLGLALARQALQRQGGSAHARNNPDGGATVYVELPIVTDEQKQDVN